MRLTDPNFVAMFAMLWSLRAKIVLFDTKEDVLSRQERKYSLKGNHR